MNHRGHEKKIVLCGNNRAAINALQVLNERNAYDIHVVVPFARRVHGWHESLYDYAESLSITDIYEPEDINNPVFLREMEILSPDLILSVYYDQLFKAQLLGIPRYGCVNVHPALLPAYRGVAPLIWAILNGETETGVTFHRIDEGVDTGAILMQERMPITRQDTGYSLHMKAAETVKKMLPDFLDMFENSQLRAKQQTSGGFTYRNKDIRPNDIDWDQTGLQVYNKIRALTRPLPGAYSTFRGQKVFLWSSRLPRSESLEKGILPGCCRMTLDRRLFIACTDQWLEITEIGIGGLGLSASDFIEKLGIQDQEQFGRPAGGADADDFIVFGAPSFGEEEIAEISDTLRSGWIGMGNKTRLFEERFRDYSGAGHAIAVSSCSAALHLSLWANEIGVGDEVITTPMTFAATISAILLAGATPVLADIEADTLNIDAEKIRQKISGRTRAIMPVHFAGLPCDMDAIDRLANDAGLMIIEDAAHAVGGHYASSPVGSRSNATCFSFYPNKNMTTGEGGMITTGDAELAEKLKIMRLHGLEGHAWKRFISREILFSHVIMPGFKYNFTDLQASLGIHQLKKLDRWLDIRERYAGMMDAELKELPGVRLQDRGRPGVRHALHMYVVLIDNDAFTVHRDVIVNEIKAKGVGAAIHYLSVVQHPYFKSVLPERDCDLPVAASVSDSILSLPLTPAMSENDVRRVISTFRTVCEKYQR